MMCLGYKSQRCQAHGWFYNYFIALMAVTYPVDVEDVSGLQRNA